jgi:hypothetical protein
MTRRKTRAKIFAADGTGGMSQIEDRRFEGGDWPISFEVPKVQADMWLQYLSAECRRRNWNCSELAQMEAKVNSGSITIQADKSSLALVWERKREGPLRIRARSAGASEFASDQARELFEEVSKRCATNAMEKVYLRGQLQYVGLPWRGELWLSDSLRLGPPSRQDEALFGSLRIVLVDTLVDAIDRMDADSVLAVKHRELSVFLSVAMRTRFQVATGARRLWTRPVAESGEVESQLRWVGYTELDQRAAMPTKSEFSQVPFVRIQRPDFTVRGTVITDKEISAPEDIVDLWHRFEQLSPDLRKQFLQAGSLWQLALSITNEYPTAAFALMVAACEALKPSAKDFRNHNIYHVVEGLLGEATASRLKEEWFRPQIVRHGLFHGGEFRGSEFVQYAMTSSYVDPTFDHAGRELAVITAAAIVEWLRKGGSFVMPPLKLRSRWRGLAKRFAFAGVMMLIGLSIGWLLWR